MPSPGSATSACDSAIKERWLSSCAYWLWSLSMGFPAAALCGRQRPLVLDGRVRALTHHTSEWHEPISAASPANSSKVDGLDLGCLNPSGWESQARMHRDKKVAIAGGIVITSIMGTTSTLPIHNSGFSQARLSPARVYP